ncbi:hypothetical protein QCA50_013445 [Cerrena zonata]|uniref:Protein-S-isoprenylcysteine O-methyltransferase n=1 Tax=Cerrena zonata TaxID=2478898 RepID=A0AAW0G219_9APHY
MSTSSLIRLATTAINMALVYRAGTPPNPPAKAEARQKYEADKSTKDIMSSHVWWIMPTLLLILFFPNLIESYVILTSHFPALSTPHLIDTIVNYASPPPNAIDRIRFSSTFLLGSLLLIFGAAIRISCYYYLGKHFTFELSVHDDHKLVTSGPYSIVRHPSYSGNFLIVVGSLACQWGEGSWWREFGIGETTIGRAWNTAMMFILVTYTVVVLVRRTDKEDRMLRKEFKGQWDEWSKQTPCKLIPGVY